MLKRALKLFLQNKPAIAVIVLGSISWSMTMIRSGLKYGDGVGFWGANGHDGIWHIALVNSLARPSLEMPIFAGESIKNYHIGFDLILALIYKLTTIPIQNLYFQVLPIILSVLVGLTAYAFIYLWRKSKAEAFWGLFFIYFGGSWGWLVQFLRYRNLDGESMFWSQQSISTLINPPFALSLIIILAALWSLLKYLKFSKTRYAFYSILFFGILIQIKAYAGVIALFGLFVMGAYEYFSERRIKIFKIFLLASVLSLLLFFSFSFSSSSIFVFKPFWFWETMMLLSDRVNWPRFGEAMVNYKTGQIWHKALVFYFIAFLIFVIGNLGTRIIGLFYLIKTLKNWKKVDTFNIFFLAAGILSAVLVTFYVQKGTPWNTIQFFYYLLFIFGIFSGIAFANILKKFNKNLRKVLVAGILIFTLPTSIGSLFRVYLTQVPPAQITKEEMEALNFLAKEPDGIILTFPFDLVEAKNAESNPPRPLYRYVSTAYVAAYSKKNVYLEDEMNLDIMQYDWQTRRAEIENFYQSLDENRVRNFLLKNNIDYIYWLKPQRARLGEGQLGLIRIFENKKVDIYKVIK